MIKCTECKSVKLEYLPDVDRMTWVSVTYLQKDGEWKANIIADGDKGKDRDVSMIKTHDIYDEDAMPFFRCLDCTAEIDGRYV